MPEGQPESTQQRKKLPINLDNFLPPVEGGGSGSPTKQKALHLDSPRSLTVVNRMGYSPRELMPIHPKQLWVKGVDNKDTHRLKWDNWEQKRNGKIEECREEYEVCKEFTKYASLRDYALQPIKKHWEPDHGDPTGMKAKLKKSQGLDPKKITAGGGETKGSTAIKMMAEAAANKASQMMEQEFQKMEAIKRRQKREIDRVIESEGNMAKLQAKMLNSELIEIEKKKVTDRLAAENRKKAIKARQNQDLLEKRELDEEILKRNRTAAKEMEVERRLAEQERKDEIKRRKEAREKEMYAAELMRIRQAKTQKIFDDLEEQAEQSRIRIAERNARIAASAAEAKRLKSIEIKANRDKAELRIERAKKMEKDKQVKKKTDFDKRVADHIIMKAEKVVERKDFVEAQAKALRDKHARQKNAYKDAMKRYDDFKWSTIKHAEDRDGYYEEVQKVVRLKQLKQSTENGLRQKEVWDNVKRINKIHDSIQQQRQSAADADDERTDSIVQAKKNLVEERKAIAHDANMRKWRVNECMERMRIANKFTNLEKQLDEAMNPKKSKKRGMGDTDGDISLGGDME
ncbi:hypothetical protein TrVE_jg3340 [Triparma verrucosa]|uniref:Uncharacterized protein n=1 Tax=Triparma verrucosa TaxID=1606542 RepID=A0A9W7EL81_9STRA|nr:hypothetical protein TrVE_jg3340 [Triparma verrucosa]